ncbi:hypothetical protein CCP1ISM_50023 [Azospirillaceae bacterium]
MNIEDKFDKWINKHFNKILIIVGIGIIVGTISIPLRYYNYKNFTPKEKENVEFLKHRWFPDTKWKR